MEQNSIKGIPYGLTDYTRLARENYYYVDKTHFIPLIEQFASYLFLIRPRRFGKTLLINMLAAYYDINNADRFEWFLEKATEVGVSAIVPLETEHSERRVFKPERAGKVITAAMKQSLKAYRPELHPLTPFREAAARPFEGRKFIAHCAPALSPAGKIYLPATLRKGESALVFIGPEGDFSDAEIAFARANGFEEITLGTQRLRTETAAVVATVMASVANAGQ